MNQAFSFIESQKESLPSEVSLLYKNKIEPLRKLYQQKSTDALTVRVKFKDEKEEKLHTLNVDVT
jgi:hypothetical protein